MSPEDVGRIVEAEATINTNLNGICVILTALNIAVIATIKF